jgi:hypothetical protein
MNELKRRGRPPKAKPEMVELPMVEHAERPVHLWKGETLESARPDLSGVFVVPEISPPSAEDVAKVDAFRTRAAQAYAMRVWNGQAPQVSRKDRIERVKRALAGQNLPFEGVELP